MKFDKTNSSPFWNNKRGIVAIKRRENRKEGKNMSQHPMILLN
jgi:hypothetical protein